MEYICMVGESDLKNFTPWWESHLPAWLIVYCLQGEAELTLEFRPHDFRQGMVAIIAPDMFPAFAATTDDFRAFYCLIDRNFAESLFYDLPKSFFDAIYAEPIIAVGETMKRWTGMLNTIYEETSNSYRQAILTNLLHAVILDFYDKWEQQYGDDSVKKENNSAEVICRQFYNLVFDHFKEHRNTAFYADKLCITPCYLAMVTRQVCHETPKQAIDRQVTLDLLCCAQHNNSYVA